MSPRELIILSLGLAIFVVVLRGLYVAMKSRRGQIRLAIDKNIPQDVDLDALELAELPGGGARVVARSLQEVNRQNSAVTAADAQAEALALGNKTKHKSPIPVLMDPVELRHSARHARIAEPHPPADTQEPLMAEAAYEDPDDVLFDYSDDRVDHRHIADDAVEDTDESLTEDDYEAAEKLQRRHTRLDTMSQVTPDYPDDDDDDYDDDAADDGFFDDPDEEEEDFDAYEGEDEDGDEDLDDAEAEEDDDFDDDADDTLEEDDNEDADDDDIDDDYYSESLDDLDIEEDEVDVEDDDVSEYVDIDDDDLDEFSMTAGERIGFTRQPAPTGHQSGLFDDSDTPAPAAAVPKPKPVEKRKPLFGGFGRKEQAAEPSRPAVAAVKPAAISKPVEEHVKPQGKPAVKLQEQKAQQTKTAETPRREAVAVKPAQTQERLPAEPSEVVVINVMAKPGRAFSGDDLLHVLITSGLKFGDMNIFHRRLGDNKGPVIFSVANILNPGTFDLNKMVEFTTLGISLFMALPTPINNLEAFNQMLHAAQQIRGALDGELRDDNRNVMTAQTTEHYRQRIRDFELRRLKAVGARV